MAHLSTLQAVLRNVLLERIEGPAWIPSIRIYHHLGGPKMRVLPIIQNDIMLVLKPMVLGIPHLKKPRKKGICHGLSTCFWAPTISHEVS